jgi:hypothetical protein
MRLFSGSVSVVAVCIFALPQFVAQAQTGTQENPSLSDIARQNRQNAQPSTTHPEVTPRIADLSAVSEDQSNEDQYKREMQELLSQRKFEALDKAAREARATKTRFPGGIWKLYVFYEAVTSPAAADSASEADWTAHMAALKSWAAAQPQSITARVALAQAYVNWGWKARGKGFADTVTERGGNLLDERVEQARTTLMSAAGLQEKCPYWFEAMQHVALSQGWDKSRARALLDQAVSFEPGFYHFYREYVNFLLPKWYGEEGEAEAFVSEVSSRVGGPEGAFLYFELATVINCSCGSQGTDIGGMSWTKIKQGYAALEQLYGTSSLKMNRFAYIACLAGDNATAHDVLAKIGTNWDAKTWGTRQRFDSARMWAVSDTTPQVPLRPSK